MEYDQRYSIRTIPYFQCIIYITIYHHIFNYAGAYKGRIETGT